MTAGDAQKVLRSDAGVHFHWAEGDKYVIEGGKALMQPRRNDKGAASWLVPILAELRAEGIVSAAAQARALNARNVPTSRGGKWTARSVINAAMLAQRP